MAEAVRFPDVHPDLVNVHHGGSPLHDPWVVDLLVMVSAGGDLSSSKFDAGKPIVARLKEGRIFSFIVAPPHCQFCKGDVPRLEDDQVVIPAQLIANGASIHLRLLVDGTKGRPTVIWSDHLVDCRTWKADILAWSQRRRETALALPSVLLMVAALLLGLLVFPQSLLNPRAQLTDPGASLVLSIDAIAFAWLFVVALSSAVRIHVLIFLERLERAIFPRRHRRNRNRVLGIGD